MNTVDIQLFGKFQVNLNGQEIALAPSVKETLALLVVTAGNRLTAKGLWKVLYEYLGIKFSSAFYSHRIDDLESELDHFQVSDLLLRSCSSLRSCRLNLDVVHCDYYEMLDGKLPFGEKTSFLPEYEWAKGFYQRDWSSLHDYCHDLKL